ncbi:MAG: threonine/serine dehydratase [Gemmatimonadota bacterium]|nr:threonine/serine dehydratase [Gemmatimonadota bacterium]
MTPTPDEIAAAALRLQGVALRTPLERSDWLSAAAGAEVYLKLENQQRTGSFKLRGAYNAVALHAEAGVDALVTASAGNHGAGVAWSARALGLRATVFVPAGAPETKRRRIARLGAELRTVDGGYDEAHAVALRHAESTGLPFVNAFSDPEVVAGQATVGVEILEELPGARTLLVPAGGGGLVCGIGIVARARRSGIRVVGVQTEIARALHDSLRAGALVAAPTAPSLCEGLAGDTDARSLALAMEVVDSVVLVREDAVRRAVRHLFMEEGWGAEPSGAVAVAALLEGAIQVRGPVALVLSGANVDAALFAEILLNEP